MRIDDILDETLSRPGGQSRGAGSDRKASFFSVSNELAETADGEDGGSASDDLPDMSAPPNQGASGNQGSSCTGYPWEPWPHMPPPAPGAPPRPSTARGHGLLLSAPPESAESGDTGAPHLATLIPSLQQ